MNHNQIPGGDPDQRPGDQNNNRNGKGTKNGQTILIFLVISLVVLLLVNFMNGIFLRLVDGDSDFVFAEALGNLLGESDVALLGEI